MTHGQIISVLERTRNILEDPKKWLQGRYSIGTFKDKEGVGGFGSPNALVIETEAGSYIPEAFCITGALYEAERQAAAAKEIDRIDGISPADETPYGAIYETIQSIEPKPEDGTYTWKSLAQWNDDLNRSHADVLALLEVAIAREKVKAGVIVTAEG